MTRRVQINFKADDNGGSDRKSAAEKAARKPEPAQAEQSSSDEVPEGTSIEIMSWVGNDKKRAQRALDVENEHEKPRKTLVSQLKALLDDDEDKNES